MLRIMLLFIRSFRSYFYNVVLPVCTFHEKIIPRHGFLKSLFSTPFYECKNLEPLSEKGL